MKCFFRTKFLHGDMAFELVKKEIHPHCTGLEPLFRVAPRFVTLGKGCFLSFLRFFPFNIFSQPLRSSITSRYITCTIGLTFRLPLCLGLAWCLCLSLRFCLGRLGLTCRLCFRFRLCPALGFPFSSGPWFGGCRLLIIICLFFLLLFLALILIPPSPVSASPSPRFFLALALANASCWSRSRVASLSSVEVSCKCFPTLGYRSKVCKWYNYIKYVFFDSQRLVGVLAKHAFKYTNRYFILPPGPHGLVRPPHI